MSDIEQRVKKIVAEQLGVAEVDIKIESGMAKRIDARLAGDSLGDQAALERVLAALQAPSQG